LLLFVPFDNKNWKYQVIYAQAGFAHQATSKFILAHAPHPAYWKLSAEIEIGHSWISLNF
jgi:hypothetical protein